MRIAGISIRERALRAHMDMIRRGQFAAARRLYQSISRGIITLGLCDADWQVEAALESWGIVATPSADGRRAWARV